MSGTMSAKKWKHMYFVAITKHNPSEISLSQQQIGGLLSLMNVSSAISTGAVVEPQYLINQKGITVWLMMYTLLAATHEESLTALESEGGLLHLPSSLIQDIFGTHIHWPEEILSAHPFNLPGYCLVLIPFLVPATVTHMKNLPHSLKAPDGSLEIFLFSEFDEHNPEALLVECESIVDFIQKERPDITRAAE